MVKSGQLDQTFAALADPTRRAILDKLTEGEWTVSDLAAPFAMSLPAVSKHLQVLEGAGLVTRERRGRVRWCRLNADPIGAATSWLERYRQFWTGQFDALDAYLGATGPDDTEDDRR